MQLIHIIHEFHTCEFTCELKLIFNPQINVHGAFKGIWEYVHIAKKNLLCIMRTFPDEVLQGMYIVNGFFFIYLDFF